MHCAQVQWSRSSEPSAASRKAYVARLFELGVGGRAAGERDALSIRGGVQEAVGVDAHLRLVQSDEAVDEQLGHVRHELRAARVQLRYRALARRLLRRQDLRWQCARPASAPALNSHEAINLTTCFSRIANACA